MTSPKCIQRTLPGGFLTTAMVLVIAAMVATGCAKTRQTRSVTPTGFLKDYSQLEEGKGDEAELIYVNPNTDFSKYDKFMIDSVTMWASDKNELGKLSKAERQALTDYFYQALHRELSQDYTIVKVPGPGTLRMRAAITEAKDANVTLDAITTIIPQTRLLSSLGGLATNVAVIVGKAGAEGEITDSQTNERLLAGVDRRVGAKRLRGVFSDWDDVQSAFDTWAKNIRGRLAKLRTGGEPE